jgi:thiol-disulfide isomerase/thioredoxin
MPNPSKTKPAVPRWHSYAVNALLLMVLVAGIRSWQQRDMLKDVPPALSGTTLSGLPYNLSLHPARPVLVHFWATWCPICRAEQASIAAISRDSGGVITVAMQSGKPQQVQAYMREQQIDFAVINDAEGSLAQAWGVHAVPASFIISPKGKIEFVEVGYTTGIGLRLRLWWAGI